MDDSSAPPTSVTRRQRVWRATKLIYVVVAVVLLFWALWSAAGSGQEWSSLLAAPGLAGFVAGWCAMATLLGVAWGHVISAYLGIHIPARIWLPLQGAAWAGRYLPGKIGIFVGKAALLERYPVGVRPLGFTVAFEQIAFLAIGVAVMLLALPVLEMPRVGSLALPSGIRLAIAISICVGLIPIANLIAGRLGLPGRPGILRAVSLVALYLLAHLVPGAGMYMALAQFMPNEEPTLLYVISLLASANVAGMLAVFAPAGLGVREAVLVAGLTPFTGVANAISIAAVLRILSMIADLVFVLIIAAIRVTTPQD